MSRKKGIMIWSIIFCMLYAGIAQIALGAWQQGNRATADFTKILIGRDGKEYYINEDVKTLFYNSNGKTSVKKGNGRSKVRWRYLRVTDKTEQASRYGYCVEFGASFSDRATYRAVDSGKDKAFFQNLSGSSQKILAAALNYGRNGIRAVPVSGANDADFYFATQVVIWEAQQRLRVLKKSSSGNITGTKRVADHGMSSTHMYRFLKGRSAEKCYNWLVAKIDNHLKNYTFASFSKSKAPLYTLKYDKSKKLWKLTLMDKNKKQGTMKVASGGTSGIKITRKGNQYTITSKNAITKARTLTIQTAMSQISPLGRILIWNCSTNSSNQSIAMGAKELFPQYLKLKTAPIPKTPVTPTKPPEPKKPVIPTTPEKPTVPEQPTEPTLQTEQEQPTIPAESTEPPETEQPPEQTKPELPMEWTELTKPTKGEESTPIEKGTIKISKKGETFQVVDNKVNLAEKDLQGVIFEIIAEEPVVDQTGDTVLEAGEIAGELITDAEGSASSEMLYPGNYYLQEKETPEAYVLDTRKIHVQLNPSDDGALVSYIELMNQLKKGSVVITKTDVSTGQPLPNTGIEIYNDKKEMLLQSRTDENGRAEFHQLPAGDYYFREFDAPEGYQLDDSLFPFSIKEHGQVVKCKMTNEKLTASQPQTGDNFSVWLLAGIMSVSAGAMGLIRKKRKV